MNMFQFFLPIAIILGAITVAAATTTTTIKEFSDGVNDFSYGSNTDWPFVLTLTVKSDGAASQAAQKFSMKVTSLPQDGANYRVYKTLANGNDFFQSNPPALVLGENTKDLPAVAFDRAVKIQFSSGDVEFESLTVNGVDIYPYFNFDDLHGTWKVVPEGGLMVYQNEWDPWWGSTACDIERTCYFDDTYTFNSDDNTFIQDMHGETWLEEFQTFEVGCGTPKSPHDGQDTYTYTTSDNTITLNGKGAFLGLAKVKNNAEYDEERIFTNLKPVEPLWGGKVITLTTGGTTSWKEQTLTYNMISPDPAEGVYNYINKEYIIHIGNGEYIYGGELEFGSENKISVEEVDPSIDRTVEIIIRSGAVEFDYLVVNKDMENEVQILLPNITPVDAPDSIEYNVEELNADSLVVTVNLLAFYFWRFQFCKINEQYGECASTHAPLINENGMKMEWNTEMDECKSSDCFDIGWGNCKTYNIDYFDSVNNYGSNHEWCVMDGACDSCCECNDLCGQYCEGDCYCVCSFPDLVCEEKRSCSTADECCGGSFVADVSGDPFRHTCMPVTEPYPLYCWESEVPMEGQTCEWVEGKTCPCAPYPNGDEKCQNGGVCTDEPEHQYSCSCAAGYQGDDCGTISSCGLNLDQSLDLAVNVLDVIALIEFILYAK